MTVQSSNLISTIKIMAEIKLVPSNSLENVTQHASIHVSIFRKKALERQNLPTFEEEMLAEELEGHALHEIDWDVPNYLTISTDNRTAKTT